MPTGITSGSLPVTGGDPCVTTRRISSRHRSTAASLTLSDYAQSSLRLGRDATLETRVRRHVANRLTRAAARLSRKPHEFAQTRVLQTISSLSFLAAPPRAATYSSAYPEVVSLGCATAHRLSRPLLQRLPLAAQFTAANAAAQLFQSQRTDVDFGAVASGHVDLGAAGVGEGPGQWQIVRLHGEHVVPGRDRREVKAPIGVAAHRKTAVKDYRDVRSAGFTGVVAAVLVRVQVHDTAQAA